MPGICREAPLQRCPGLIAGGVGRTFPEYPILAIGSSDLELRSFCWASVLPIFCLLLTQDHPSLVYSVARVTSKAKPEEFFQTLRLL